MCTLILFFYLDLISFRFVMKKMYDPIKQKKSKDDFENFETPQHIQTIDMPYFASLKTTQLLY